MGPALPAHCLGDPLLTHTPPRVSSFDTSPAHAMKTTLFLLSLLTLLASGPQAQDAASVNWSLIESDGLAVTASEGAATGITVRSQTIVPRDYTGTLSDGSSGPLGPYQRWWLDGAEWPVETGPDAARYVEFVVAPEAGGSMTVTGIDFIMNAGGTGEMDASVFTDTDAAFASPTALEVAIDVSRDAVGTFSYTVDEPLASGDSLYVRIYPWLGGGNPSTGRYIFLQDMTISGTSEIIGADVDGVLWTLSAADTTSVTAAGEGLGGAPVRSSDVVVRDYDGDLRDAGDAVGPYGPFQRWWRGDGIEWPVETAIDPTRYVEFAAGADAGETFYVDGVSLYAHGDGTSEMRASVFYSTNADFSNPVALEEDFNAGDGDFGGPTLREYPLSEAIASGDSIYVRVYPYLGGGNPSVTRFLMLQALTISGSTQAPVEGVFWALTEADTTSVTEASPDLGGSAVRSSDLVVRDYTGDLRDAGDAVGPLGPFQRWWLDGADWPDDNAPNPTRYVEFVAGAGPGLAFAVDSVAVYIHGDGTSAMKAQVAYSTSADFSNPVVLAELVDAGDGDFGGPTLQVFDVDATVSDSIYVRVYPWVRSSSIGSGRYLLLQAMGIYGTPQIDTATDDAPEASGVTLYPSAPNPVRSTATIRFSLAEAGDVDLAVVDLLGRRIATLARGPHAAGEHTATLRADGLASGVYVLQVRTGESSVTQRIVVAR